MAMSSPNHGVFHWKVFGKLCFRGERTDELVGYEVSGTKDYFLFISPIPLQLTRALGMNRHVQFLL